ncbi:hypothetical protein HDF16_006410, partial [Granulicella aggregans]|nr:hypothetical protein [Granulicella aggregans]
YTQIESLALSGRFLGISTKGQKLGVWESLAATYQRAEQPYVVFRGTPGLEQKDQTNR